MASGQQTRIERYLIFFGGLRKDWNIQCCRTILACLFINAFLRVKGDLAIIWEMLNRLLEPLNSSTKPFCVEYVPYCLHCATRVHLVGVGFPYEGI